MNFDELVTAYGGVVSTAQLLRTGESERDIAEAVSTGILRRLRHGWYATSDADEPVVGAVERGGVASCLFALRRSKIWVPGEDVDEIHSRVTRYGQRRHGNECRRYGRPTPPDGAVDDIATSLQYAARCLDDEGFIVVCDSIANKRLMTLDEIERQFAHAPRRILSLIQQCDARADSGIETMVRKRLRGEGFKVTPQYKVAEGLHADLLVGERLALEIDGRAYHVEEGNYEYDRWRDRQYLKRGVIPSHLSYQQVVYHWPATFSDIQAICKTRLHRDRRAMEALRRLRAGAGQEDLGPDFMLGDDPPW